MLHFGLPFSFDLGWIFLCLSFRVLSFFRGLSGLLGVNPQQLFSPELSIENLEHRVLLLVERSGLEEWRAQLHYGNGSLGISDSGHVLVDFDGGQRRVTDLLTVSNLILPVVEVPNIKESVNSSQEEQSSSGWRPVAVS